MDVNRSQKPYMIEEQNFDVRTITMNLLLDCIDSDIDKAAEKSSNLYLRLRIW